MLNGIGTCTIGATPLGYGDPDPAGLPIDHTQEDTARYIDPRSKDFRLDADTGEYARMPAIRQRVLLALTTLRGSSAGLPNMGIVLPTKMGTGFERSVRASIMSALYQLTDIEKAIRVDDVLVDRTTVRATITVSYTDLTTGETDTARL